MKLKFGLALAASLAFLIAASTWAPRVAEASPKAFCRDCPFPAKVADGRWLMPNGHLQLDIRQEPVSGRRTRFDITLTDATSGEVVATGVATDYSNHPLVRVCCRYSKGAAHM